MKPEFDVVRDPLWDNIRLDRPYTALVDTPTVQRLRYVRQLGHAFLVYPGATHSYTVPGIEKKMPQLKYDEAADKKSWEQMLALFKDTLGK